MNTKAQFSLKDLLYIILIVIIILITCIFLTIWIVNQKRSASIEQPAIETVPVIDNPDYSESYVEEHPVFNNHVTISAQIIEDGLRDMSFLLTSKYFFSEVIQHSENMDSFFSWLNGAQFIATIDGEILAGVDCSQITIDKDDSDMVIFVTLPCAITLEPILDHSSFNMILEKNGFANKIDGIDYNNAMQAVQTAAHQKALDRGILTAANDNAQNLIEKFIRSLVGTDYSIFFEVK